MASPPLLVVGRVVIIVQILQVHGSEEAVMFEPGVEHPDRRADKSVCSVPT